MSYESIYKDEMDYSALAVIEQEFFAPYADTVGVTLKTSGDSNRIIDNRFMFASWAGPSSDITNTIHEIAHMIEIDDARCHLPNWGLKTGKWVNIGGQFYPEGMHTKQAIMREVRTFAIQLLIQREHGISYQDMPDPWDCDDMENGTNIDYMASICEYIDGIYLFHPSNKLKIDFNEAKKLAYKRIAGLIEDAMGDWSYAGIMAEWDRKMSILCQKQKHGCWRDYA